MALLDIRFEKYVHVLTIQKLCPLLEMVGVVNEKNDDDKETKLNTLYRTVKDMYDSNLFEIGRSGSHVWVHYMGERIMLIF